MTLHLSPPQATQFLPVSQKPTEVGGFVMGVKIADYKPIQPLPQSTLTPVQPAQPISQAQAPTTASAPAPAAASAVVAGCGDNSYAQYIYQHESGCNLNAVNSIGCRGIGQACPGSKLPCGADYACQNAFFTAYANSAYGGWAGAYAFWVGHHWW